MNKLRPRPTFLNTRPQAFAAQLSADVETMGWRCIEFPLITIQESPDSWTHQLQAISHYELAIFTSQSAVEFTFRHLSPHSFSPQCIAIGHATKQALHHKGFLDVICPPVADSEHLLNLVELTTITNKPIILFKGRAGRQLLVDALILRQAQVSCVDVYQRECPKYTQEQCIKLASDEIDMILYSSVDSLSNAFELFANIDRQFLIETPAIVFSERIQTVAKRLGIKKILISPPHQLVDTLKGSL